MKFPLVLLSVICCFLGGATGLWAQCEVAKGLTCEGEVTVILNEDCAATVGFSDLLVAPEACLRDSNFTIEYAGQSGNTLRLSEVGTRTFTIRADGLANGDRYSCRGLLTVRNERPDLAQISLRPTVLFAGCTGGDTALPPPRLTDFPYLATPEGRVPITSQSLGYGVEVGADGGSQGCGDNYSFVRSYTIIDSCVGESRILLQNVLVGDFRGPRISSPTDPHPRFPTLLGCNARFDVRLPGLAATDDCGGLVQLEVLIFPDRDLAQTPFGPYRLTPGNNPVLSNLIGTGDHLFRVVATDACGNRTVLNLDLEVYDDTAPTVRCLDTLNVSITTASSVAVTATELDDGSFDNCGIADLSVINGPIRVSCEDTFGKPAILQAADLGGNLSRCTTVVRAASSDFVCLVPPDTTLACDEYRTLPPDFTERPAAYRSVLNARFGSFGGRTNCGEGTDVEEVWRGQPNSCGVGTLRRQFRPVGDGFLNGGAEVCEQSIVIQPVNDYTIRLPGDKLGPCVRAPVIDEFSVTSTGCDLFLRDERHDTILNSEFCHEVVSTYEIINWCEYRGSPDFIEIIRDANGNGDTREAVFVRVRNQEVRISENNLEGGQLLLEDYSNAPARGAFRYVSYERRTDATPPVISQIEAPDGLAFTARCTGGVDLVVRADDACDEASLTVLLDFDNRDSSRFSPERIVGQEDTRRLADGRYQISVDDVAIGEHLARITSFDDCGNSSIRFVPVRVTDGKRPRPVCIDTTEVTLTSGPDGSVSARLTVADLIAGPPEVCTASAIGYGIDKTRNYIVPGFRPTVGRDTVSFDCVDAGTTVVRVYGFAESVEGSDFCEVRVRVRAAPQRCDGLQGSVSGRIVSLSGLPLAGVTVNAHAETTYTTLTDEEGRYDLRGLDESQVYLIEPVYNDDYANGLSVSDIFMLSFYLEGRDTLSPEQLVAADVNASRAITILDLYEIRDLLLRRTDNFRNVYSWRFLSEEADLKGLSSPWNRPLPGIATVDFTKQPTAIRNFRAVKTGDLTGDALPPGQDR